MIDPLPTRRLVIVVRADPVICGHSGEARNLAEAALQRGYDDVRIVTWPIEALGALPLKPLGSVLPYSPGIVVERPEPVGDYKVPDGRFTGGMVGRLVELFTDGVPTVCISLYLTPHASVVVEALAVCRAMGIEPRVTTIAEAVGSDITNVVRSCVEEGRFGAAAHTFTSFLAHDHCVAVSEYTLDCIIAAADDVDAGWGTSFGQQCRERVGISYPAIDCHGTAVDDAQVVDTLARRGLERDRYVLFLSRISPEKGVDDLIDGYARSAASDVVPLVIAGTGPALDALRERAARSRVADRIVFLDDVDDAEKWALMAGCATFVLPSKATPAFVETFGIALVEKMLAGGGTIITTATGGIPEAVGPHATTIPVASPA
ncbi:MAG: glycosyltransferase, partial [Actinomycetota bacterium]|nr:glycosyltransferase [Actinomycetota bacterium]